MTREKVSRESLKIERKPHLKQNLYDKSKTPERVPAFQNLAGKTPIYFVKPQLLNGASKSKVFCNDKPPKYFHKTFS